MRYDVVIAGAGPVGLSLALRMAKEGKNILVLEKNSTTHEHSRAPVIWPRTQEILADIGALDRLVAEGIMRDCLKLHSAKSGKAMLRIPLFELKNLTPYPQMLIIPQSKTEKILNEAVQKFSNAEVRFSSELVGCTQHDDGVTVLCSNSGTEESIETKFLIGCDGAHSVVRKFIDAHLEGKTYTTKAALADVQLQSDLPSPRAIYGEMLVVAIQIDTDLWRLILPFTSKENISLEQRVRRTMQKMFPDTEYEDVWQSEFRLHNRISTKFVDGRIVLAGDAAHLNSPVGGQGMNAGIQDTKALGDALVHALDHNTTKPLALYGKNRSQKIRGGVNRFTDTMTKVVFFRNGALFPVIAKTWNLLLKIPPIRRKFLKKIAMVS